MDNSSSRSGTDRSAELGVYGIMLCASDPIEGKSKSAGGAESKSAFDDTLEGLRTLGLVAIDGEKTLEALRKLGDGRSADCVLLLLSDMLLYTTTDAASGKLKMHHAIPFDGATSFNQTIVRSWFEKSPVRKSSIPDQFFRSRLIRLVFSGLPADLHRRSPLFSLA